MSRVVLALALALAVVGLGCERDKPPAAPPAEHTSGAPVVESPGVEPSHDDGDATASGDAGGDEHADDGAEDQSIGRTEIVVTNVACQTDADCVPDSCCHATSCVAVGQRPDCSSAMCTADCRAGTMDCNGGCLCQGGKCAAKLWWAQ